MTNSRLVYAVDEIIGRTRRFLKLSAKVTLYDGEGGVGKTTDCEVALVTSSIVGYDAEQIGDGDEAVYELHMVHEGFNKTFQFTDREKFEAFVRELDGEWQPITAEDIEAEFGNDDPALRRPTP